MKGKEKRQSKTFKKMKKAKQKMMQKKVMKIYYKT